jgi:hypothetical protein
MSEEVSAGEFSECSEILRGWLVELASVALAEYTLLSVSKRGKDKEKAPSILLAPGKQARLNICLPLPLS